MATLHFHFICIPRQQHPSIPLSCLYVETIGACCVLNTALAAAQHPGPSMEGTKSVAAGVSLNDYCHVLHCFSPRILLHTVKTNAQM